MAGQRPKSSRDVALPWRKEAPQHPRSRAHAQISAIDTTGVIATSHPLWADNAWRDDQPQPSLPTADALANAPDANRDAGLFRVPKVLGAPG